jgi:hypothetical protein
MARTASRGYQLPGGPARVLQGDMNLAENPKNGRALANALISSAVPQVRITSRASAQALELPLPKDFQDLNMVQHEKKVVILVDNSAPTHRGSQLRKGSHLLSAVVRRRGGTIRFILSRLLIADACPAVRPPSNQGARSGWPGPCLGLS